MNRNRVNTRRMKRYARQVTVVGAIGTVALLVTACGGVTTDNEPTLAPATSTSASSTASPITASSTALSTAVPTSTAPAAPTSSPPTQAAPPAHVVSEGSVCGPRGAVAVFADSSTAYCARLQYTDGAAWSRDPNLAPNPAAEEALRQLGPQIGDQCIGADIGRTAVDVNGAAIVCDNYRWQADVGQEPEHPWADAQAEWSECLEEFTQVECQEMLN